jgi:hypothetical protein
MWLKIILLLFCFASWAQAADVRLAWNPNSEADLAGYRIHYGTASGSYTVHVDVGNVTTTTISGLADGVRYYFAATAYDTEALESGYSNEVNWQSGEPPVYIGATGLRVSRVQVGSAPMADVTRTGTAEDLNSPNQTGSQTITVPADCTCVVITASGYYGSGDGIFGAGQIYGLGGADFAGSTKFSVGASGASADIPSSGQVCISYLVNPSTGSQTLRWSLPAAANEGVNAKILYYKNIDTGSPLTDSDVQLSVNADLTGLTAGASDMMVGVGYKYGGAFTSVNDSGQTELNNDVYNSAANGTAEKLGGTGFYFTGGDYTICCAIVLKAASGGGTSAVPVFGTEGIFSKVFKGSGGLIR